MPTNAPAPTTPAPTGVCDAAAVTPLEALVDLRTDATAAALAFSGASASAFDTPSRAPLAAGSVRASLDDASLGTTAAFSVGAARAASVAAVLRTPTVYRASDGVNDRDEVIVATQVRDAGGNSQVLRTGLSVVLQLDAVGGPATQSTTCSVAATSGLATCALSVPDSWFGAAAGAATATVRVEYTGEPAVANASVGSVTLAAAPSHGALSSSGMTLALPESPRFPGDDLDATLSASLVGVSYGLKAWTVHRFSKRFRKRNARSLFVHLSCLMKTFGTVSVFSF